MSSATTRLVISYSWLGLLLWLAGCAGGNSDSKYLIGFSQCTAGDAWRRAMHEEMRRELSFHPESELIILDAKGNSQQQLLDIDSLVSLGIDLLIVSPNEAVPITPKVEELFQSGLPVVVVDRRTSSSLYSAYVGADNYEIGRTAGEYMAQLMGEKGKILEVWGLPGSSPARDRHQGFADALQNYPNLEIVDRVYGDWEKNTAITRTPSKLASNDSLNGVFAHNDVMALGSYQIAHNLGRAQKIHFIGVDGLSGPNAGLELVQRGVLDATMLYPTGGKEAIQIAMDILQQRSFGKENILQTTVIDSSNVRVMKLQAERIFSQQLDIEKQAEMLKNQLQIYQNQRMVLTVVIISLILAIALAVVATYLLREKQRSNFRLETQKTEILQQRNQISAMAEQAQRAQEAKLHFFTNVSHEFRTPLTLILGTLESLQRNSIAQESKKQLTQIRQNAVRLLRLVNQLMDFRKVESGKMKLQATQTDLVAFIGEIFDAFRGLAQQNQIDFRFLSVEPKILLWFDQNMLDKVIFNLLSNAFKFTPNHGQIYLHLEVNAEKQQVRIAVEDSGRGMTPEQSQHAFDRYYQVESGSQPGTGLGLALSKELIELHHGHIEVQSQLNAGTTFSIYLPLGKSHLNPHELAGQQPSELGGNPYGMYWEDAAPPAPLLSSSEEKKWLSSANQRLLIIEDNAELRHFLVEQLKADYHLHAAADGDAGTNLAFEQVPDLIVCDVMLPRRSGLSIVKQLKEDLRTSHIPVIMLTAQTALEQRIAGVQAGADVYLTKPFSTEFLKEQIRTLLRNRERLRERYLSELQIEPQLEAPTGQSPDREFINRFIAVVEGRLSDSGLNMQAICEEMNLSRVQVYRKVKALLGYSASDYLKYVRLKHARQMLANTDQPISEIAEAVGFTSPAYFSTAFKARYQQSPSEFRAGHL